LRSSIRRKPRSTLDALLARLGYLRVPSAPEDASIADHRSFNPQLHSDLDSLPVEAAEYLREGNQRLVDLRRQYDLLEWPVCTHSRWKGEVVSQWLNLQYFRGDNIYVWNYRSDDDEVTRLRFFVFLRYVVEQDSRGLLTSLGEDGAFGCWKYEFPGYPPCSRDLLDSVNELLFLDRSLSIFGATSLRILDIGAGYGRLAYRSSQALPGLLSYCCVDAVPESTFISEYYLGSRGVSPPARVIELNRVVDLEPGEFDLAINVHSFSECPLSAIEWWMELLSRLQVPHLFVVPNESNGFLSLEVDGSRLDYLSVIQSYGYQLAIDEPVFDDPAVRAILDVRDRFCLFELAH
jgi:hypothetical protein